MQISSKIEGTTCIVSITGSFSPDSTDKCEKYLDPLVADPSIQLLLLNCHTIDSISSAAWGLLLDCNRRLLERHARFALCEGNRVVQAGLRFMGLEKSIAYFVTEEEALRSMQGE